MSETRTWPAAHVRYFRELCGRADLSRAGIAHRLNLKFGTHYTRNACIGKAFRMGIAGSHNKKDPPHKIVTVTVKRKINPVVEKPIRREKTLGRFLAALAKAPIVSVDCADSLNIAFDDLHDKHCRYITSENPTRYCGAEVLSHSFCGAHLQLCYLPPKERRRAA